jgi:hypothetical protein
MYIDNNEIPAFLLVIIIGIIILGYLFPMTTAAFLINLF